VRGVAVGVALQWAWRCSGVPLQWGVALQCMAAVSMTLQWDGVAARWRCRAWCCIRARRCTGLDAGMADVALLGARLTHAQPLRRWTGREPL
jgi:hypothetical protein